MDDFEFSLVYHLQKKQEVLRSDYGALCAEVKLQETDLSSEEIVEIKRMCRWHKNSHITEGQWLQAFHQISCHLNVEEKMDKLDESFTRFLSSKFRNSSLKDGFNVTELLDVLENPIRELYESRISCRNEDDEFDIDNISIGRKPGDNTFFERSFFPAAILFTYQEIHQEFQGKDLWADLFTLGSGAKGYDLIPETNPICEDCASVYFPNLKHVNPSEIFDLNVQVFKRQKDDMFKRPSVAKYLQKHQSETAFENSSSDDDLKSGSDKQEHSEILVKKHFNPFSEEGSVSTEVSVGNAKKAGFNPFSSEGSSSDEDSIIMKNSCVKCKKSFSLVEYLDYHNRVFHDITDKTLKNTTKFVVSKFVSDGEEMMTSFIAPDDVEESEPKIVEKEPTPEVSKCSREFNLRKRSRRKLDM